MQPEAKKYLFDIQTAANLLDTFVSGRNFAEYQHDLMLRAATERQFEVIGEAISQLARIDPATAAQISEYQRIIAFRNILIHGYAEIDNRLVWDIIQTRLPRLREEASALLNDT